MDKESQRLREAQEATRHLRDYQTKFNNELRELQDERRKEVDFYRAKIQQIEKALDSKIDKVNSEIRRVEGQIKVSEVSEVRLQREYDNAMRRSAANTNSAPAVKRTGW